ncbi:MAG: cadmium resistance transporter [Betaproteobacteria bacterium]|nr:cadmium resistance transporter [Betaproteobacteria bacterium]
MPESIASLIGIAALVYASTNLDDLLILAVFFADPRVRAGAVVAGRFIALAVLVLASGAAALLALAVPEEWIALLGLVPLILGMRLLLALFREGSDGESEENEAAAKVENASRSGFAAQMLAVAGVSLANDGDNLGVYIPLFAATPSAIPIYVVVFAVMTIVFCALGYLVVNNPLIGRYIRRYGDVLLPVVLIPLGLFILSDALPLLR